MQCPESWSAVSIAANELVPIVLAAAVWGRQWLGKKVLFSCDNDAVVTVVRKGNAKDSILLHLL